MADVFSKVTKMGKRLWVQIPQKDVDSFSPGDPVWIRKINRPGDYDA